MNVKNIEVVDIFQGVTLENTQGWNKQKTSANVKNIKLFLQQTQYSSNLQYNDSVEYIWNGMWFKNHVWIEVWELRHVRN